MRLDAFPPWQNSSHILQLATLLFFLRTFSLMPALSHTVQLRQRLSLLIESRNAEGLCATLASLRNADFRTASQYLGQGEVWRALSEEEFWHFFRVLAIDNAKAYVGTLINSFMNYIDFSATFCALNIVVLRSTSIGVFHKIVKNLIVLIFNSFLEKTLPPLIDERC